MNDHFFIYIGYELAHLNDHLPEERVSLKNLIKQGKTVIKTKTGEHYFEKSDIDTLKSFVPREFWNKIYLPLIFLRKKEVYEFTGNIYECFLIKKILNGERYTYDAVIETDKRLILYTPQIIELKKKFKSIFVIGFSI